MNIRRVRQKRWVTALLLPIFLVGGWVGCTAVCLEKSGIPDGCGHAGIAGSEGTSLHPLDEGEQCAANPLPPVERISKTFNIPPFPSQTATTFRFSRFILEIARSRYIPQGNAQGLSPPVRNGDQLRV